jgi:glyoxylase-like metal-dependent hydrolase (beta-lactamase superfamily II)
VSCAFRDSCNVYAIEGPKGCLIVDAGTGLWVGHLGELPAEPVALACTHFFRDHSAAAVRAAKRGIPVFVPEGEKEIFADPALQFLRRESYIVYDNYWDFFAPIEAIPVAGVLRDHETIRLGGLELEVVPLPGATLTQVGLVLVLPNGGRRVVFCGEAIHSPGSLLEQWAGHGLVVTACGRDVSRRRDDSSLRLVQLKAVAFSSVSSGAGQDAQSGLRPPRPSEYQRHPFVSSMSPTGTLQPHAEHKNSS